MKDYGLVSIITPNWNCARFISETIKSVQAQTYQNWEMIIVDDCSTDGSDKVVEPFMKEDRRIRFLRNEKNSGAAVGRNYALREAKGRWIAFLDSDDLWMADKLEKQLKFMVDNGYHFSYHNSIDIDEDGKERGRIVTGPKRVGSISMYNYDWVGCLAVMYDTGVVGLIQIEDIKKNNDYAMWLKVCKNADCYLLDEILAKYRVRAGSISRQKKTVLVKWHYKMWHEAEHQNPALAGFNTIRNMFFGLIKKLLYEKYY